MGTLVAGIKDIFSPAKSTGTNVMLSGGNGTPDGHISMDDLASVLGNTTKGKHFVVIASGAIGASGNPHNYPVNYGAHIKIATHYAIHILMNNEGTHLWLGASAQDDDYPNAWNSII